MICFASALLFRLVYRRCGNPLVAIVLTAMAGAGASIHWLARPHLFTMLFMVIFMTLALDCPFRGDLGVRPEPYQLIYDHLMKP